MHDFWPVELLGRFATDAAVIDALGRHGIGARPVPEISSGDARPQWLLGSLAGVEFGFEPTVQSTQDADSTELQLSQVYLYGKHPHVAPYGGPLPFGLLISDNRATVRTKLAAVSSTCRIYKRDAWDMGRYTLVVAYANGGTCIDYLLFLQSADSSPHDLSQRTIEPSLDAIVRTFGQPLAGDTVEELFAPLGWQRRSTAVRNGGLVSLRQRYGIDVIGRAASAVKLSGERPSATSKVLAEVVLHRPGSLGSAGWMGELPFGLQWNDSPAVLADRVPQPPDDAYENDFSGWTLKHETYASVQIHYSTMENFMVQIRVLAPGLWTRLSSGG